MTTEQRLVLQSVYDWFREHGEWPTFVSIDRPLRRKHGLDTRAVIQLLPGSLIVKPLPATWFAAEDKLRLRLPGIHVCDGGREDTERFVRLLRWLAQKEVDFDPAPDSTETIPCVTSEEARRQLGLDDGDQVALCRLYVMLQMGSWGLAGNGNGPDGWQVFLSSDIWRFRNVRTVEDCLRVRLEWRLEVEATNPRTNNKTQRQDFHVDLSPEAEPPSTGQLPRDVVNAVLNRTDRFRVPGALPRPGDPPFAESRSEGGRRLDHNDSANKIDGNVQTAIQVGAVYGDIRFSGPPPAAAVPQEQPEPRPIGGTAAGGPADAGNDGTTMSDEQGS
ncbi:MAG TPA: hypothetical protein VH352_18485 [Pseudonocardiaceae bacterium]|nr:hypothetical protein [Pseudonocardiaceae bacterium]